MMTHDGVTYLTTTDLANCIEARGLVITGGSKHARLLRARRWATKVGLNPAARTRIRGYLWDETTTRAAWQVDNQADVPPC